MLSRYFTRPQSQLLIVAVFVILASVGGLAFAINNGILSFDSADTPYNRYAYLTEVVAAQATADAISAQERRAVVRPTPTPADSDRASNPIVAVQDLSIPLVTLANQGAGELEWRMFGVYQGTSAYSRPLNVGVAGKGSRELAATLERSALNERFTFVDLGADWYPETVAPFDMLLINVADKEITSTEATALSNFHDSGRSIVLAVTKGPEPSTPLQELLRRMAGITATRQATFAGVAPGLHEVLQDVPARTPTGQTLAFTLARSDPLVTAPNGDIYMASRTDAERGRIVIIGGDLNDWQIVNPALVRRLIRWSGVSWLFVTPQSGALEAYGEITLSTMLETSSFLSGTHSAEIWIESNDPALSLMAVPMTLEVQGEPWAAVDRRSIDFGAGYVGYPRTRHMVVQNRGTSDLTVSDISSDRQTMVISPTLFSLAPLAQQRVSLVYTAQVSGDMEGALTLTTNNVISPTRSVAIHGVDREPPQIAVNPVEVDIDATQLFTSSNASVLVGAPRLVVSPTATPASTSTPTPEPPSEPTPESSPDTETPTSTPTPTPTATPPRAESEVGIRLPAFVQAKEGTFIYASPERENTSIGLLPRNSAVWAIGRSADGEWFLMRLLDEETQVWMESKNIFVVGNLTRLPIVSE
jgi:hypothetical protein